MIIFGTIIPNMEENITKAIAAAIMNLLRPMVMFLLRNGVPYQTFADIAKRVYVDLATEKFDIPGRKQSKSRVSILTGLSRREVLRVKRLPAQDDLGALDRINRAARVIAGWVRDHSFSDESGQPMDLPFDEGNVCFLKLVKLYSGDAPARAVLDELMRVGVVERTPTGGFTYSNVRTSRKRGKSTRSPSSAATRRTFSRPSTTISAIRKPHSSRGKSITTTSLPKHFPS